MRKLQHILNVLLYTKTLSFHNMDGRLWYEVEGQDPFYMSDNSFKRLEKEYLEYQRKLAENTEK